MGSELNLGIEGIGRKVGILDTNLLMLEIGIRVGLLRLRSFSRVSSFSVEDAALLRVMMSQFKAVATTAYVLAEASNLGNKLSGRLRTDWFTELSSFALHTDEAHVGTQRLGSMHETIRFGVADAALTELAHSYVILTAEFRLSGHLRSLSREVINFNHFRAVR